ncbi:MAG: serine dehydratase subunit alpha family protein [Christensenellales bacterium]|jgi:L-cysteine desulfidase
MTCTPLHHEQELAYTQVLKGELIAAMGCTEPIAIAYCAALATRALGKKPETISVWCSGNVIKNSKTVTVPNTGGLKGIKAAALAGAFYGDAERALEVLAGVTDKQAADIARLMETMQVPIRLLNEGHALHIRISCAAGNDQAEAEILDTHTHIGAIRRNGETIYSAEPPQKETNQVRSDALCLTGILAYARQASIEVLRSVLSGQVTHNPAIAREGLNHPWGAQVGKTILETRGESERAQLVARAAAGSDARMNGCPMPVVINSGSGNQGLTVSIPVITRAQQLNAGEEKMLRALALSNLIAIHQKTGIGRMSAYCGAVSAAIGSACGIAFLEDVGDEVIARTITNALMIVSGMLCDGAKSSCAAKIAAALDSALLAYDMAKEERAFLPGEGLMKHDVEDTISAVSRVAREGMRETDLKVLHVMLEGEN